MVATSSPGSLVFCHSSGIYGRLIRLGERLRFRSGAFYNHVAIIEATGTGSGASFDPYVIQAIARGITKDATLSTIAPGGSYEVVSLPPSVDASSVLAFALNQVGQEYGFLSILSIALRIVLPRWLPLPTIRSSSTWICSAVSAESLRAGGWIHNWPDIYSVVPSQLYATLHGINVREARTVMLQHTQSQHQTPTKEQV